MISGQKFQSIAQLVRQMNDPIAKKYITDRWGDLREKTKTEDDDFADKLIDAISTEKVVRIAEFI